MAQLSIVSCIENVPGRKSEMFLLRKIRVTAEENERLKAWKAANSNFICFCLSKIYLSVV